MYGKSICKLIFKHLAVTASVSALLFFYSCSSSVDSLMDSISVDTDNARTIYYPGDTFTASGLVVKANLEDGTTRTLDDYTVTVEGAESYRAADGAEAETVFTEGGTTKTVTITYGDYSTAYEIKIQSEITAKQLYDTMLPLLNITTLEDGLAEGAEVGAFLTGTKGSASTVFYTGDIYIKSGSSSSLKAKKDYAITLEEESDLFSSADGTKSRSWLLLDEGNELNTVIGLTVSSALGLDYASGFETVNIVVDDNYKGTYLLVEDVKDASGRIMIERTSDDGSGECITTSGGKTYSVTQNGAVADKETQALVLKALEQTEAAVKNGSGIEECIDTDSFARYLIAHDVLGTMDATGSELTMSADIIEVPVEAEDETDGTDSEKEQETEYVLGKLYMTSPWGFDSNFVMTGSWSAIHINTWFYYYDLMQDPDFVKVYTQDWNKYSSILQAAYKEAVGEMTGNARIYDTERNLDAYRWGQDTVKLSETISSYSKIVNSRFTWLGEEIDKL